MKIICIDNYNRDDKSDRLVCENINEPEGHIAVNALNDNRAFNDWYRLVEDDYQLYTFEGYWLWKTQSYTSLKDS